MVYHHSASLVKPNGDPWDGFFSPTLTLMIDPYNIFQDVTMENMVKTVLPHVVTVLVLMYVQKQMVLAQETVPLVLKDCNVLLV